MHQNKCLKKSKPRRQKEENNIYVAAVSWLANTSSADYMQSEGKNAKLSDGDSLSTVWL